MKRDVALRWADALESGRYPQGQEALRTHVYGEFDDAQEEPVGVAYCCLGVLCDLSGLGEWDEDDRYLDHESFLPPEVAEWAGISNPACTYDPALRDVAGEREVTMSTLNDRYTWDFRRIAALIRERWEEL